MAGLFFVVIFNCTRQLGNDTKWGRGLFVYGGRSFYNFLWQLLCFNALDLLKEKLSDLLRYILYDCETDEVSLIHEIEYIDNCIDLQELKASSKELLFKCTNSIILYFVEKPY